MRVTADRLLGFVLLGLAAFVAVQALQWQIPFSYEPVRSEERRCRERV